MLKFVKALSVLLLTVSLSVSAGIRVDGQLIKEGDSVSKLVRYMGSPATKSFATTWCTRKKMKMCTEETWSYFADKKTWLVTILNNRITNIDWER